MRYIKFVIIALLICPAIFFSKVEASDYELKYLKDLKSITISNISLECDHPEELRLSREKIKSAIELKLRICGLDIKPSTDLDTAFIDVKIMTIEKSSASAAYVCIEIKEFAELERTYLWNLAPIWSKECLFLYGNKTSLGDAIVNTIKEMMDEFSNSYLKANPRQFISTPSLQSQT